jgi:hypothetical protein
MKRVLALGLTISATTAVFSAADVPMFGRATRLLRIQDVSSIRTLAGRDILAKLRGVIAYCAIESQEIPGSR